MTKPAVKPRRVLKCCDNLHDVVAVVDVAAVDAVVAKAECAEAGNSRKGSNVAVAVVVVDSMLVQQCAALNSRYSLKYIQEEFNANFFYVKCHAYA